MKYDKQLNDLIKKSIKLHEENTPKNDKKRMKLDKDIEDLYFLQMRYNDVIIK